MTSIPKSSRKPTRSREFWHPRYWHFWLVLAVIRFVILFPYRIQLAVGRWFGHLFMRFSVNSRYVATTNIKHCFPNLDEEGRERLLKQCFESCGIGMVESSLGWWGRDKQIAKLEHSIKGLEHLQKAVDEGKGVLLFIAHFTPLHIAGRILRQHFPFAAMYQSPSDPFVDHVIYNGMALHCDPMLMRSDIRALIKCLKQNKIVWYAPDVNTDLRNGMLLPFLGIQAATLTTTPKLARVTGAKVMPFFFYRREDGSGYDLEIMPALEDYPSGDLAADTMRINQIQEQAIYKRPDQYLWIYKRFKTRPENESKFYKKIPGKRKVKLLSVDEFDEMVGAATMLAASSKRGRPRMMMNEKGDILKFFYQRKKLSASRIKPYALRFAKNCKKLLARGIDAVCVKKIYYCPEKQCHVVRYIRIPGKDIRECLASGQSEVLENIPGLLADLHKKGIFFRSVHLGNILQVKEDEFGLVDVANVRFYARSLRASLRARNIIHMFENRDDEEVLGQFGLQQFVDNYFQAAKLDKQLENKVRNKILKKVEMNI